MYNFSMQDNEQKPGAGHLFSNWQRGPDFGRIATQTDPGFQSIEIDLTNALDGQIYGIAGTSFAIDSACAGIAWIDVNSDTNADAAKLFVSAGFTFKGMFLSIKITAPAQPGKKLRIIYSVGGDVSSSPGSRLPGNLIYEQFKSSAALAANTPQTIIDPSVNKNGAYVHLFRIMDIGAVAGGTTCLLASKTPPATIDDGYALYETWGGPTVTTLNGLVGVYTRLDPGYGVFYISDIAVSGRRRVSYQLF